MMKDTDYKKRQGERQCSLIEENSCVFYGAKNRGVASWRTPEGRIEEGKSRKVLQSTDREKNLYEPVREAALKYMEENNICWWQMPLESDKEVTAHTLSSQVHCLNHLFEIRNDEISIKSILQVATGILFDEILPSFIDKNSLISFEFVYENSTLLSERCNTRGANCTSVDALIYARKGSEKWLIPIEWKYTEAYNDTEIKVDNYQRYINMVTYSSRLSSWHELYYQDPFYELGRQTLLMEKIIEKYPEIADQYFHIIVVPEENVEMMADAIKFKEYLKKDTQDFFGIIDPSLLMSSIEHSYPKLIDYLKIRYWYQQ